MEEKWTASFQYYKTIISFNNKKVFRCIPEAQQITSSLIISDLKDSDSSNYSCTADNKARTPVSSRAQI